MIKSNLKEIIGVRIKIYRKEKKISQQALADAIDVDRCTITNIENGKQNFSIDKLIAIASFLDVEMSKLTDIKQNECGNCGQIIYKACVSDPNDTH